MTDFDSKHRPVLERLLEPGETLDGICAASQQLGLFKGRAVALGVTPRRLILQPLDRRGDADGEATSLAPGDIAAAGADGVSGGWPSLASAVMDRAAVKLTVKTRGGEKLKLMMMRGGGVLGGGEGQQRGVEALARWFEGAGS
ncbi:MAG TPA: hypothetical protein VF715_14030 [Thermoleophilaceae bacterium]|jgi:hypothetical protein